MPPERHGPNAIVIDGTPMLLTITGGGVAVHLAAAAGPGREAGPGGGAAAAGPGREAVDDLHFGDRYDGEPLTGYDRAALTEPRWSPRTLCGREWAVMAGGDGGPVGRHGEVAYAPTCRRCLALIDRHFPPPTPDSRLALVARLAADTVVEQRGFAEIHGVPGDQEPELRRTVRALIRERTGHSVRTYSVNGIVFIECRAIHDQHADRTGREAAEAVDAFLNGEPLPRREKDWLISWTAWDVG